MVGLQKERALREMMARLGVREEDIEEKFIRSQGPGGQNVNKVSTCVHLRHLLTGIEGIAMTRPVQKYNLFLGTRKTNF